MKLQATIGFWSAGVGCFCHEAVSRALCAEFGDVTFGETDLAYEKYERVADNPSLQKSAWFEYLRSGPRFDFVLPSGTTGRLSRYSVEFTIHDDAGDDEIATIESFLSRLALGRIRIERM